MYHMLKKIGCPILEVPDLSGRFVGSISNVGILPAFLLGINVEDFLAGLKKGYEKFMNFSDNSALNFSVFLYKLYKKGYKVVFSMPYSLNLEGIVGLFVQEISESTVYSLASQALPNEIKEIYDLIVKDFVAARKKTLEIMLKNGLSGLDMIKQLQSNVWSLDIENIKKLEMIKLFGEIEFRLVEGSDEFIQIEALLSGLALIWKH